MKEKTLKQNESQAMALGQQAGWEENVKIFIKSSFKKKMCPLQPSNFISQGLS